MIKYSKDSRSVARFVSRTLGGLAILALVLIFVQAAAVSDAYAVFISQLHNNTSSGVPAAPYGPNTYVTISGIVTSPDSVFNTYSTDVYVQDETGGIDIYVSAGIVNGLHFSLGDSVTFSGYVKQFSGLTELDSTFSAVTLVKHASGRPVPEPLVLTCAQMNASFGGAPNYSEPNESRLIRINGVQLVSGTWPTTPQTVNVTLQISDGTATSTLFIDKDTNVDGSPQPIGYFDVIGILKQYDTSSPYTTGYEITPRYATDIIQQGLGPIITVGPEEDSLTTTSARIFWTTNTASTSVVDYGTTTAYGSTVQDPTLVTEHVVRLNGLTPNTLYHYQVSSTDAQGTRTSLDHVFVTVSDLAGELHIFFNKSVETSYSTGTPALGNQDMHQKLVERINAATTSIDCSFYSFSLSAVTDALIAAKNRGVQVRFIIEYENSSNAELTRLVNAGIPLINSTFGGNHGQAQGWGVNHNKFAVFDCVPGSSKTDDWVWTGSWNCSISGDNDANNSLTIQDYGLASAYKIEFNEMWGSETATPDANNAKEGSRKSNNTPHEFTITGIPIQEYMSPSDGVENRIIQAIGTADSTIFFCILSFTSNEISLAMKQKWDNIPGFQVRGVFDGSSIGPITSGSEWYALSGDPAAYNYWSPPADVWQDQLPVSDLLHHKYMIIDSSWPDKDPTVVTGSHNWSNAANTVNDENTLIIHSPTVANIYLQEFAARYHQAGGSGNLLVSVGETPGVPAPNVALETYPNPFNPTLNVRYLLGSPAMVSLRVFDVSGRLVKTLQENHSELPGFHSIPWDGKDSSGKNLGSGVYIVRLEAGKAVTSDKVVLLK